VAPESFIEARVPGAGSEDPELVQKHLVIAAAGTYAMAALSFSGIPFQDMTGRLLVGVVWLVPAVGWTLRIVRSCLRDLDPSRSSFWPVFTAVMLFLGITWLAIGISTANNIYVVCPGLVGLVLAAFGLRRIGQRRAARTEE
jgi:hypothetical protein